jgi:two-component system chemotaxis response regulator CheB
MSQAIRVLVVEDSPAQRELLVALLRASGEFNVVGTAEHGARAVQVALELRPDVIAMDIHLPVMDGYEATRQIMQRCPTPIVLVSNSSGDADQRSVQALAAGALAVVRKPGSPLAPGGAGERDSFLRTLRLMSGVRVVTRHAPRSTTPPAPRPAPASAPEILAVAASTGGPAALQTLLAGLGPAFPLPILIAQHIARGFTGALVDWLVSVVPQPIQVVAGDVRLQPGVVYFPPDDMHLVASGRNLAGARPGRPADRYCPSADTLFDSVAQVYGGRALGVIMTGMGDDGARGLGRLRALGATTFAQDEASCVVYGMPQAAVAAGAVSYTLPLGGLAGAVLAAAARAELQRARPS